MDKQPAPVIGFALAGVLETGAGVFLIASIGPASIALFFLTTGVCTLALASQIGRLLKPVDGGPGGSAFPPDGENDGGPAPTAPWPEFEAAFREYARERQSIPG